MFILRTFPDHESETNTFLGEAYSVMYKDHKEFSYMINSHELKGDILALVFTQDSKVHPIYKDGTDCYIMTHSGKTFFKFKKE